MGRLFGGNATDRVTVTATAVINDIPLNANALTLVVTGMRTTDDTNQQIVCKYSDAFGQTSGFALTLRTITNPGQMTGQVASATAANGSDSDASNVTVLNQNEVWAMTWAGINNAMKLFRSPIDTPIAEVTGYATQNVRTTAPGADNTADLLIGNKNTFAQVSHCYQGWTILYAASLTLVQLQRVHYGILVHRQGWLEANAVKIARGAAILKSIAGYRMLLYMAQDGTYNEYSGNAFTVAATGTTLPADNEITNFDCPTTFEGDAEPYNQQANYREQFDYTAASSHARARYSTTATAGSVWAWSNLANAAGFPIVGWVNTPGGAPAFSAPNAIGYTRGAFSGLSAGAKTIILQNPHCGPPPGGTGTVPGGNFMSVVFFNAAFTRVVPTPLANQRTLLCFVDSIGGGSNGLPPQQYGYNQLLRNALPSWLDEVATWGYGGMQLKDIAFTDVLITQFIGMLTAMNPRAVYIAEGFNDRGLNTAGWTAALWQVQLVKFIRAARVAGYRGHFYIADEIIAGSNYEAANVNGDTLDAYRAAAAGAVALSGPAVEYVSMKTAIALNGTNFLPDTAPNEIHPNAVGQTAIHTNRTQAVFAAAPTRLPSGTKHRTLARGRARR